MSVSKKQIRDYCRPFLRRKSFRFKQLNGMVEPRVINGFGSNAGLQCPGLVISKRRLLGIPAYFYLSESSGHLLRSASVHLGIKSHTGALFRVNVTENAARLVQVLDYWLATKKSISERPDAFRILLTRVPQEQLLEIIERVRLKKEEIPVLMALDISCMRLLMERLEKVAQKSKTPREFLLRALNANIDSALAHEATHLEEFRVNGASRPPVMIKEAIAYLIGAIYADPADAFRSMMLRGFDVTTVMPSFDEALRKLGPGCFCVGREFLRNWARAMADAIFMMCNGGKSHEQVINVDAIQNVQTSDFIKITDMQLVERVMYNPNLRISRAEWEAWLQPNKSE